MKRLILLFTICCIFLRLEAQNFKWAAKLRPPDSSMFYNIFLTSEITSKLKPDFSDIRLYDEQQNEIPYLKRVDKTISQSDQSFRFKILENEHRKWRGYTQLLIHNPHKKNITNINLLVQNVEAEKWLKLSGSDDKQNWFIIKDQFQYLAPYTESDTVEIRILDFPVSNYEYYEILLFDYKSQAIKIYSAKYYDLAVENVKYLELPPPIIEQNDTLERNRSVITITFKEPQYIDKLIFEIRGPNYYFRKAGLVKGEQFSEKKLKLEYYDQLDKSFQLTSTRTNEVFLSSYRAKSLKLLIDNKDDEPLKIRLVKAYQLQTYISAFLQANDKYTLHFGNKYTETPVYDLRYFIDSIPDTIPQIAIMGIQQLKNDENQNENEAIKIPSFYLWIVVGVVTALLAFVSYKMFGEVMNKETDEKSE